MMGRKGTLSAWVAIGALCLIALTLLLWQVDNPMVLVGLLGVGLLSAGVTAWERRA